MLAFEKNVEKPVCIYFSGVNKDVLVASAD